MNINFLYKYFYMIVEPSSGHLQNKFGLIIFFFILPDFTMSKKRLALAHLRYRIWSGHGISRTRLFPRD